MPDPDPPGPHRLPLSEQQHRLVIEGRRLGDSSDPATVIVLWDQTTQRWVFYLHGSTLMAACFTDTDVRRAAEHVLGRTA